MGSLSSIKQDLETVEGELLIEVTNQVDLEERLQDQTKKVKILKDHKAKLQRALDILEGNEVTLGVQEPQAPLPAVEPVKPVPPRPYSGPLCGACGARMYETYRTVPSGVTVRLLKCEDSGCNNENYG